MTKDRHRGAVVLIGTRFVPVVDAAAQARRNLAAAKLDAARNLFDRILEVVPDDAASRMERGVVRFRQGDLSGAIADFEHAIALRPDDGVCLTNLGQALLAAGRKGDALNRFESAVRIAPGDAIAHTGLAMARHAAGDIDGAVLHYQRAAALDPGHADAWRNLGILEMERDRPAEALRCLEIAASAHPDAEAFALLASVRERQGDLQNAGTAARKALELTAGHPGASLTLARVQRRSGDAVTAEAELRRLVGEFSSPRNRRDGRLGAAAAQELALILEKRGLFEEAWSHFQLANEIQRVARPDIAALANRFRDLTDRLKRTFAESERAPGQETSADRSRLPAFLIGFPRSGTTLLVRALSDHPLVRVMDEKPVLSGVLAELAADGVGYPEGLAGLTPEALSRLRGVYWRTARAFVPDLDDAMMLVDKDPLHTVHIGLIQKLFPGAPIVYSVRDPRDACLSCFGNIFRLTPALATFDTLEGAADTFARVAALWFLYRDRLALRTLVLRYEDLVAEFEGRMKDLIRFFGLPWDDAILNFHEARNRPLIRTPSYDQVDHKPHRDAVGRWRHYQKHFGNVEDILRPWLEKFGYT